MIVIIQKIIKFINQHFTCWHEWENLTWHGLPNEPFLMRCKKCGHIINQ
jgi:hypothetical protein